MLVKPLFQWSIVSWVWRKLIHKNLKLQRNIVSVCAAAGRGWGGGGRRGWIQKEMPKECSRTHKHSENLISIQKISCVSDRRKLSCLFTHFLRMFFGILYKLYDWLFMVLKLRILRSYICDHNLFHCSNGLWVSQSLVNVGYIWLPLFQGAWGTHRLVVCSQEIGKWCNRSYFCIDEEN